jgi:hypothetical protein
LKVDSGERRYQALTLDAAKLSTSTGGAYTVRLIVISADGVCQRLKWHIIVARFA